MASTSAPRRNTGAGRAGSVLTLCDENQSLIAEIRKAVSLMREIAVDLEKDHKSEMVKELEDGVIQLLEASNDCAHLTSAIKSIGNEYHPSSEATDFKKMFDDEIKKSKSISPSIPQNQAFLRQFREAIWNVHHAGVPMPGEEQEDVVMTNTDCNLLNVICPITGKPVTDLAEPVRSKDCKHIYEKNAMMQHIRSMGGNTLCPIRGCTKELVAESVECDPYLVVEIDELRSMSKQTARPEIIEDFTESDHVYED